MRDFGNPFRDIYRNRRFVSTDRDDYAHWIYYHCGENYDGRRSHRYDIEWTSLEAWRGVVRSTRVDCSLTFDSLSRSGHSKRLEGTYIHIY